MPWERSMCSSYLPQRISFLKFTLFIIGKKIEKMANALKHINDKNYYSQHNSK